MNSVSIQEMFDQLNLGPYDPTPEMDDSLISDKIAAAEAYLENFTGKAFISQVVKDTFNSFSTLVLSRAPTQSIVSIVYLDTNNQLQTLPPDTTIASPLNADYPAIIQLAPGKSWPTTAKLAGAVTVTFTAGYGDDPAAVPSQLREAVKQLAAAYYEDREAVIVGQSAALVPMGVFDLIAPFRAWEF